MKTPLSLSSIFLTGFALGVVPSIDAGTPDQPVYELRTYTTYPGKLDALLARFRDHTCALFEKHGMTNVAYFVPMAGEEGAGSQLVYLLRHASRAAAKASWEAFRTDPDWIAARDASQADGKLVSKVESIFLSETDYSEGFAPAPDNTANRVFEMRTYRTRPGRLPALDARFRDHTKTIFARHGMTSLGYFHPIDADDGAESTLIYFLAHASREAADASWNAFRDDPEWKTVREASQADGPILQPKGVTRLFLVATDFSPVR